MRFFVAFVFVMLTSSANATSLFCNNANEYSNNFDSFISPVPNLTVVMEYNGPSVVIAKYANGNLFQSFTFGTNQIYYTDDFVRFENSTAIFFYDKRKNYLIFNNANHNRVVLNCR